METSENVGPESGSYGFEPVEVGVPVLAGAWGVGGVLGSRRPRLPRVYTRTRSTRPGMVRSGEVRRRRTEPGTVGLLLAMCPEARAASHAAVVAMWLVRPTVVDSEIDGSLQTLLQRRVLPARSPVHANVSTSDPRMAGDVRALPTTVRGANAESENVQPALSRASVPGATSATRKAGRMTSGSERGRHQMLARVEPFTFRCLVNRRQPCEVAILFPKARAADLHHAEKLLPCDTCVRLEHQIDALPRLGHVERHVLLHATSEYEPIDPLVETRAGYEALSRAMRSLVRAGLLHSRRETFSSYFLGGVRRTCSRLTPMGAAVVQQLRDELANGARIRWQRVQPDLLRALRRRGNALARTFARSVREELARAYADFRSTPDRQVRIDLFERLRAATRVRVQQRALHRQRK